MRYNAFCLINLSSTACPDVVIFNNPALLYDTKPLLIILFDESFLWLIIFLTIWSIAVSFLSTNGTRLTPSGSV